MKSKSLIFSLMLGAFCLSASAQKVVFDFGGKVTDPSGKGIAGVVVNDGISFTKTDAQGAWSLVSDTTRSKFVSISVPASCVLPQQDGLAGDYYISVTVPDLKEVIDSLKQSREVVAMTLGDLVWDNMPLFDEYQESVKNTGAVFFQCIGNHDFDKQYQDLHNMAMGTPVYGEMVYGSYFGPTDYSFNIGKAHIVTMKDINYVGGKNYVESLTGQQLEWLKKDLSYVPKGSLVILNLHAPVWNKVSPGGNVRNADALKEVLKDYKVHVFSGHTHFFQNNEVTPTLYEHNIGAACGGWWAGWVNQCGAPNGYMVVDVDGDNVKWHYKATRRDFAYQFRIYNKGEFTAQSSFVVANVWDWDSACRVVWYQDGKPMGDMEQFVGSDEERASQLKDRSQAEPTAHLFRAMPSDGARQIKIEFTNRFGEVYSQTVNL